MSVSLTPFRAVLATNATTTTAFASKTPTTTKPGSVSGSVGYVDLMSHELGLSLAYQLPKFFQLLPFGTDGSNDTFDMQVWGWSPTDASSVAALTWIPQLLLELNVVLGNIASPASSIKTAAQYLADTLTIAKGDANAQAISPANDYAASVVIHCRGCQILEFVFKADAGAQASAGANCLYRAMDQ